MRFLKKTILCLAVHVLCINAGSRAWQPASHDTELQSRYFYINVDESTNPDSSVRKWPDNTITYCFDSKESQKKFDRDLNAAQDRWISKGLSKKLKIKRVSNDQCNDDHNDREKVLKVSMGDSLNTFPGFPGPNQKWFGEAKGPTMILTDSVTVGMLDKIGNYAHELGHAWGLYHEHQNPRFWKGEANSKDGEVFGSGNNNWRCENLRDYDQKMAENPPVAYIPGGAQKPLTGNLDRQRLCTHINVAKLKRFSASQYLPMPAGSGKSVDGQTVQDVDWDSIMIYPSGAGGKQGGDDPNDPRAPILMKPNQFGNFERIKINTSPSQRDIEALCELYGVEPVKSKLLQDKDSRGFFKIFKKNEDC